MKKGLAVAIAMILLAGCSTPMRPVPTGGSRADATVDMSFEYGEFQKPVIDWNQAAADAAKRCAVWGYTGAEAFGGQRNSCVQGGGMSGCARMGTTMTYQCTGTGTPPAAAATASATPAPNQ